MASARACVKKVKKRKNKKNKKDDVKSCTFVLPIAECHKALIRERRERERRGRGTGRPVDKNQASNPSSSPLLSQPP